MDVFLSAGISSPCFQTGMLGIFVFEKENITYVRSFVRMRSYNKKAALVNALLQS
jgi:hypothetical protein